MNKGNHDEQRERAVDACALLNDFVTSLTTATGVIRRSYKEENNYQNCLPYPEIPVFLFVRRMAFHYIIIYLKKWNEFWRLYNNIIPDEYKEDFRVINNKIEEIGAIQYRNKCVGHILDNDTKRPMTKAFEEKAIKSVVGPKEEDFLRWVNADRSMPSSKSLVNVAQKTRDLIASQWGLKKIIDEHIDP